VSSRALSPSAIIGRLGVPPAFGLLLAGQLCRIHLLLGNFLNCGLYYTWNILDITTGFFNTVSLDNKFESLAAWAASPYLAEDSLSSDTEIEVSPTLIYIPASGIQVVRQRPLSPPFDEEEPICENMTANKENHLMKELGGLDLGCLPAVPTTPKSSNREVDSKRLKWSPHRLGAETLGDVFMDRPPASDFPPVAGPASAPSVSSDPDFMSILLRIQGNTSGLNNRLDENHKAFTEKLSALQEHLVVGLKLNKDEMKEEIQGSARVLQTQMDELRRNNLDMQAKLAAVENQFGIKQLRSDFSLEISNRLAQAAPVDHENGMAKLRRDILLEVKGQQSSSSYADIAKLRSDILTDVKVQLSSASLSSAASQRVAARPPILAAPGQPGASEHFIPTKFFIKGWCGFGEETTKGISTQVGEDAGRKLIGTLPEHFKALLAKTDTVRAPFYKNRQIVVNLRDDIEAGSAYELAKFMSEALKTNNIKIMGTVPYVVADAEAWKKHRNAMCAKACATLRVETDWTEQHFETIDWASGSLYVRKVGLEVCVGKYDRNRGWQWRAGDIARIWPEVSVQTLSMAME
jgi:hypothetical protein